ncbi:MAG: hypothetical protein ACD_42C00441G0004 [uncultured bacterium]|nr:MAG: hypothetical protein ACD_42C00441G0004 [uncultured bacterium]OGT33076.1 MAG: hypothetical protein A3C44_05705 [Gammaproteobacteria bacterium RIFCSPHIGHO2_02_FULL_39_13]OGT49342.1 MAG: hypothetical protein A3E53_07835 [Gammaproteobacteria bacterium RIFCSPHIGHO2_12_FULL_39_24]
MPSIIPKKFDSFIEFEKWVNDPENTKEKSDLFVCFGQRFDYYEKEGVSECYTIENNFSVDGKGNLAVLYRRLPAAGLENDLVEKLLRMSIADQDAAFEFIKNRGMEENEKKIPASEPPANTISPIVTSRSPTPTPTLRDDKDASPTVKND